MFDFAFQVHFEPRAFPNTMPESRSIATKLVPSVASGVSSWCSPAVDRHSVNELAKMIRILGHRKVNLRCDHEPAIMAIQQRLLETRSKAGEPTVLSNGKTKDSQSMGRSDGQVGAREAAYFQIGHRTELRAEAFRWLCSLELACEARCVDDQPLPHPR